MVTSISGMTRKELRTELKSQRKELKAAKKEYRQTRRAYHKGRPTVGGTVLFAGVGALAAFSRQVVATIKASEGLEEFLKVGKNRTQEGFEKLAKVADAHVGKTAGVGAAIGLGVYGVFKGIQAITKKRPPKAEKVAENTEAKKSDKSEEVKKK